jgi:hypothetical protein
LLLFGIDGICWCQVSFQFRPVAVSQETPMSLLYYRQLICGNRLQKVTFQRLPRKLSSNTYHHFSLETQPFHYRHGSWSHTHAKLTEQTRYFTFRLGHACMATEGQLKGRWHVLLRKLKAVLIKLRWYHWHVLCCIICVLNMGMLYPRKSKKLETG